MAMDFRNAPEIAVFWLSHWFKGWVSTWRLWRDLTLAFTGDQNVVQRVELLLDTLSAPADKGAGQYAANGFLKL